MRQFFTELHTAFGPGRLVVVGIAAAAALIPLPPGAVHSLFSTGVYPHIQRGLTTASNLVPVAVLDVLLVGVFVWWVARGAQDLVRRARGGWRAAARVLARTATTAAFAYLAFLAVWGLNYRATPLTSRLAFDQHRVSRHAVMSLEQQTVEQLNALFRSAHEAGWGDADAVDPSLRDAFARTTQALGLRWEAVAGRPKRTILDVYFRRAGVSGMTDPYFLETLIAGDLLPFERPLVVAHEWSHLAGITDEGEANFAGWVTCMHGPAPAQYSAWLFLFDELAAALPAPDVREAAAALADGPRADLHAVRVRLARDINTTVATAGWRVYDQYLKANRVEQGTASYAGVVALMVGVPFDSGWTPRLRR